MIHLKWFDTVELLFGPVGHTHNGNDSVHHCHNNIAGNFDSITLPEFLRQFQYAWINDRTRPIPVFFEDIYDWEAFFSEYLNAVGGFTATATSPLYVRAIKFEVGQSGLIEMHFKGSPSSPQWRGVGEPDEKYPDATGLVVMRNFPGQTTPEILRHGQLSKYTELDIRQFRGQKLQEKAEIAGLRGSLEWMVDVLKSNRIPTHGPTTTTIPYCQKGYSSVEKVGVHDRVVDLPIFRGKLDTNFAEMFILPEDVETDRLHRLDQLANARTYDVECRQVFYQKSKTRKRLRALIETVKTRKPPPIPSQDDNGDEAHSENSEADEEEEVEEKKQTVGPNDEWNADMKDCQKGAYAVVHSLYVDSYGIAIVKVNRILSCF